MAPKSPIQSMFSMKLPSEFDQAPCAKGGQPDHHEDAGSSGDGPSVTSSVSPPLRSTVAVTCVNGVCESTEPSHASGSPIGVNGQHPASRIARDPTAAKRSQPPIGGSLR